MTSGCHGGGDRRWLGGALRGAGKRAACPTSGGGQGGEVIVLDEDAVKEAEFECRRIWEKWRERKLL